MKKFKTLFTLSAVALLSFSLGLGMDIDGEQDSGTRKKVFSFRGDLGSGSNPLCLVKPPLGFDWSTVFYKDSYLHNAVKVGRINDVHDLIEQDYDVNQLGEDRQTPLYYAVEKLIETREDSEEYSIIRNIFNLLFMANANPNIANRFETTPFHLAVYGGKLEIVKLLAPLINWEKLPKKDEIDFHIKKKIEKCWRGSENFKKWMEIERVIHESRKQELIQREQKMGASLQRLGA